MARRAPTPRAAFWRAICTGTPVDSAAAPSSHSALICAEAKASCKTSLANHDTSSFGGEIKRLKLPRRDQQVCSAPDALMAQGDMTRDVGHKPPSMKHQCFLRYVPTSVFRVKRTPSTSTSRRGKSSPASRSVFILLLT